MVSLPVVLPILYLSLPVAMAGVSIIHAARSGHAHFLRDTMATLVLGAVGGLILTAIHMRLSDGHVPLGELATGCYWGMAVACVVRLLNLLLAWSFHRAIPKNATGTACCPGAEVAASVARSLVLLAVALPYVGGMLLTFQPHAVYDGNPSSILGMNFEFVTFPATDGVKIRGWWIPAADDDLSGASPAAPASSARTVILCHDLGGDKAADLRLVRGLAPHGFNVLAFDFRGHGQSDGQFTTFGDLERRDVLGAVRWLRKKHPLESKRIFGVGDGMGAAALVAAAADPDSGRLIDAIALFSPYDSVHNFVQSVAEADSIPRAGWLANHVFLPIAGAQFGTRISNFAPAGYVDQIAPRPVMVIAAEQDPTRDINLSRDLFEQASQPKCAYWISKGGRDSMRFTNRTASIALRIFFETARDVL